MRISMTNKIKEMCHKCKKYPAEYNQTYCEFCLGISNKDDYITNLQKENERLNNIINELERHLHQEILEWQDNNDNWIKAQVQEDKVILDKLKELKKGGKGE